MKVWLKGKHLDFSLQRWNCRSKEKPMLAGRGEELWRILKDTITHTLIIIERTSNTSIWFITYWETQVIHAFIVCDNHLITNKKPTYASNETTRSYMRSALDRSCRRGVSWIYIIKRMKRHVDFRQRSTNTSGIPQVSLQLLASP